MKYDDWKLITEAFGGPMNLGMKKPNVVGGPVGSKFDDMEDNDEMHGDEEDMDDEEEIENDDDYEDEDMDDEEENDDDYGDEEDDDEEDDDYDYGDEEEEDEIHPNRSDNRKMMKKDPNMDFLNDIDPNFMNDDKGDDYYHSDDEDHEDHEHNHEDGETCPECDGSDPDCEICHGEEGHEGHEDHEHSEDEYGDEPQKQISYDGGQDEDTAELISKMSSWMSKYMKKESVETEQAPLLNEKKSCNKCGKMMKKMMSKDKEYCGSNMMKKTMSKDKEYCNCESTDWIKSHQNLDKMKSKQDEKPLGSDWIKQHKDLEKRQADQNKKQIGRAHV